MTSLRLDDGDLLALHERHPDAYPVLLESMSGPAPLGRYDVLFALPAERLVQRPDGSLSGANHGPADGRFLDALDRWWGAAGGRRVAEPASPFSPGWFLFLGYEFAAEIEPTLRLPPSRMPRAVAWRMRGAVLRDRTTGDVHVVADHDSDASELRRTIAAQVDALHAQRDRDEAGVMGRLVTRDLVEQPPEVFLRGVRDALDAIARGDVYQANLSRPWLASLATGASVTEVYRALRRVNPAPFAGIARLEEFTVLSSSPERLLRVERGIASTRPIAGTRPRGATPEADAALRRELRLNEKEQAEHVMLVDLERNDLGRICKAGTVHVDEYMTIETYATVHHIVSNVRGELRDDVTPGQAIAAVFPGGTITGCPKVRCMQLLAEFEREPRGAYTGSMGYLGLDGSLDLNILIRTLTVRDGVIEFRTGAGIVADSQPEAELAETRAKAQGLLQALTGGHR